MSTRDRIFNIQSDFLTHEIRTVESLIGVPLAGTYRANLLCTTSDYYSLVMASIFADRRVPKVAICRLWVDVNFIGRHSVLYCIHRQFLKSLHQRNSNTSFGSLSSKILCRNFTHQRARGSLSRNCPQTDIFQSEKLVLLIGRRWGKHSWRGDNNGVADPCVCDRTFGHRGFRDLRAGFSPILGRSPVGRLGQSSVGRLGVGRLGRSPPTKARARFFSVFWR